MAVFALASECFRLALVVTGLKILLIPAYHSTDFEVHRNWLAITHSLPLSQWYTNAASVWTLDYPPLFAWFEWLLSQAAVLVDPNMLVVSNLEYAGNRTVIFQRCSVIISDIVLLTAAYVSCRQHKSRAAALTAFFLVAANAGLLIVDHIHFQYNGVMLGILLWSVLAAERGQDLLSGVLFAMLVNMKHLFAYAGPVYFVYLLRHHCRGQQAAQRFVTLGAAVLAVCTASFGPFVAAGQVPQILSRLFPFGRGLCHAYWAANFWALYGFLDKCAATVLPLLGAHLERHAANMAGGLVGTANFVVLPQVPPAVTMILVLLSLLPCLLSVWRHPALQRLMSAVAYSYLCGFMFGYHVHEKAILMAVVPFALTAVHSPRQATRFLLLSSVGHYALLPLLYEPQEHGIKCLLVLLYFGVAYAGLAVVHFGCGTILTADRAATGRGSTHRSSGNAYQGRRVQLCSDGSLLPWPYAIYLVGLLVLETYCSVVHPLVLAKRLPFLPLLLTSVYCAVGVLWVWAGMAVDFAFGNL